MDPERMNDLDHPYRELALLREGAPVHRIADSPFYVVTSWELIADVLGRSEDFSSNLTATMIWNEDGTVSEYPLGELGSPMHVLATADDPTHRRHRTVVMPSLVAARVRALEPFISATLRRLWEAGLHDGHIDWVHAIAERLPMAVVAEMIGLPACDIDQLVRWAFASTTFVDGVVTSEELADATESVGEMVGYLAGAFDAALADPGDDVLGDLARLVNAGESDRDCVLLILIQLVTAGAESTISLLGTSVWLLAQNGDIAARLRATPDLVGRFVEESLRLESPFRGHYRHVVGDTTLGDVALPSGAHLYLAWGAANRDPEQFDNPDVIDLDRDRRSHLAFGKGIHLCVGAALARLEGRLAVQFLLQETQSIELDIDEPSWTRSLLSRRLSTLPLIIHR